MNTSVNNSVEVETSVAIVTVAGVVPQPCAVTLVYTGRDSGRVRRDFVQQVPVRDAELARRVLAELHAGDRVQVSVVNEWREDGCDTYLSHFKKAPDVEQKVSDQNGTLNVVQIDMEQIVILPARGAKEKVRH